MEASRAASELSRAALPLEVEETPEGEPVGGGVRVWQPLSQVTPPLILLPSPDSSQCMSCPLYVRRSTFLKTVFVPCADEREWQKKEVTDS